MPSCSKAVSLVAIGAAAAVATACMCAQRRGKRRGTREGDGEVDGDEWASWHDETAVRWTSWHDALLGVMGWVNLLPCPASVCAAIADIAAAMRV